MSSGILEFPLQHFRTATPQHWFSLNLSLTLCSYRSFSNSSMERSACLRILWRVAVGKSLECVGIVTRNSGRFLWKSLAWLPV